MKLTEERIRVAIAEQAGDWFVAHRSGSLTHTDRVAFVAWLRASPVHVEEYLGVAHVAHDLPAVTSELGDSQELLVAQARADRAIELLEPALLARALPA